VNYLLDDRGSGDQVDHLSVRAIWRSSTDSRTTALWFRRAVASAIIGFLASVAFLIVGGALARIAGEDALRLASAAFFLVILPAALVRFRAQIWMAANDYNQNSIFPRPPRARWAAAARAEGLAHLVGAALTTAFALLIGALTVALIWGLFSDHPVPGVVMTSLMSVILILGLVSCPWSYLVGRNDHLARLADATPPQLRRVHELNDHSRALEQALHETTSLSEELQRSIEAEKKLIDELVQEAADARQLSDLTNEQVEALTARMNQSQRRSTRRERWINIVIAIISLAAGYGLDQISPGKLGDLFNH
jgi:uncharacterized membrane protein YqjE